MHIHMEVPRRMSSAKRARATPSGTDGNSNTTMTNLYYCLVDGCNADLSVCRDYHRRHKVCEVHSKTPKVTISGREQRFCQQCSRFHSLAEFDEGKRSCRKRLDGHNRRRRKPPPPPRISSGLVSYGSSRRASRSPPQVFQVPNNDQDMLLLYNLHQHQHQHQHQQQRLIHDNCSEDSSSFSADQYKGLLMLQNSQVPPPPPLLDHSESSHIQKSMFDNHSDHGALSLLSSQSTTTHPHLMNIPDHPQFLPHPRSNYYYSSSSSSLSSSCGGGGGPYSYPSLTQQHGINGAPTSHLFQQCPPHAGSPTTTSTTYNGSHQTHTFMWE